MGQAADLYFSKKLREENQAQPAQQPQSSAIFGQPIEPSPVSKPQPVSQPAPTEEIPTQTRMNEISAEDQTKRFGGPVGSVEYYEFQAQKYGRLANINLSKKIGLPPVPVAGLIMAGPLGQTIRPVDQETWDKMPRADQAKMIAAGTSKALAHMAINLPVEMVKVFPSIYLSGKQVIKNIHEGKPWHTPEENVAISKTGLGELPTWFKNYDDAIRAGENKWMAGLMAGSKALGDIAFGASMTRPFFQAMKTGIQPRMTLKPGEQLTDVKPVQQAFIKSKTGKVFQDDLRSYSSVTKSVAKEYGGNTSNTYFKVIAAGDDAVEIAVVRNVDDVVSAGKNWIKEKTGGISKVYQGASGKEIKLESHIVKISKGAQAQQKIAVPQDIQRASAETLAELDTAVAGSRYVTEAGEQMAARSTFPKWVPEDLRSKALFDSTSEKLLSGVAKFSPKEQKLIDILRGQTAQKTGRQINEISTQSLASEFETMAVKKKAFELLDRIPEKPLKGWEGKLINETELNNLSTIGKAIGVEPEVVRTISNIVSGKKALGELTHAEYIEVSKSLGLLRQTPETLNIPIELKLGHGGRHVSPPQNYSNYVESQTGIPLASEVYYPMEEAFRAVKKIEYKYGVIKNKIFVKSGVNYNKLKYEPERGLIAEAIVRRDKSLILDNPKLSQSVKNDLVQITDDLIKLTDEVGKYGNVSIGRFKDAYVSSLKAVKGGRTQLYKSDITDVPTQISSFAEHHRYGMIDPQAMDASALFDAYTRSIARSKLVSPVLKRVSALYAESPAPIKNWIKNYELTKLGYGGDYEKFLNTFGLKINKKLSTNLSPDVLRNLTDDMVLTVYSGALGMPRFDAPIRDTITTSLIGYAKFGARNLGAGLKKSFDPAYKEFVRSQGRLVEFGIPGGEELAIAKSGMSKTRAAYRGTAEAALTPYGMMDNKMRTVFSATADSQFDDVIAKVNAGKLTWDQAEKALKINKMPTPAANMIRQKLFAKDLEGAKDFFTNFNIDELSFPYRPGTGAPITFGAKGHHLFQLANWNIHFAHTMGSWVKTGQWDNILRFIGAGAIVKRSMEEAFGVDASRFTLIGKILNPTLSPAIQLAVNLSEALMAIKEKNRSVLNAAKDAIFKEITALGIPGGVGWKNWADFLKSYKSFGQPGIPEGKFRIYTQTGKTREFADFSDILMRAFGFVTTKESETSEFYKTAADAAAKYKIDGRNKVNELLFEASLTKDMKKRQKLIQDAEEIIKEFNITGNLGASLETYHLPLIMNVYNELPPILKARFAEQYQKLLKEEYK